METFDIGFPDRYDRERLSQSVEHLQHATLFSTLWVWDVIDQGRHVSLLEAVLGKILFQRDMLIKRPAHDVFSSRGFKVTNRT